MQWFPGSLVLAYKVSKKNQALLIIFIKSDDENGEKMLSFWDKVDPSLFNCSIVAVQIQAGTDIANHFLAKHCSSSVPATFFLAPDNSVIKVITTEGESSETFENSVQDAAQTFIALRESLSPNVPESEAPSASHVEASSTPASQTLSSVEDKIQRAKRLLEEKHKKAEEEKREEEKRKELERIETGKLMQQAQIKRQEKELLEAAEARRKDKLLAEQTRQRVLDQIKADKEEREYRLKRESGATSAAPQKVEQPAVAVNSDECRILVRFPDGGSLAKILPSKEKLSTILDEIKKDGRVTGSFTLANSYPRKVFTSEEYGKSYLDLLLTPSCTLFVEQKGKGSSGSGIVATVSNIPSLVGWLILTPLQMIWALIGSFFSGGNRGESYSRGSTRTQGNNPRNGAGDGQNQRRIPGEATIRRRGNVSGLNNRNGDESDPENANWNGNSTQFL